MDRNAAIQFWTFPDGSRAEDRRPPVTDSQLATFAQEFGVKLPTALIELYRQQNGGFSIRFESLFWPIGHGGSDDLTTLRKLCETYHEDEALERRWASLLGDLANVIVFLGDGHFYYVLNYNDKKSEEPTVCFVDENGVKATGHTFAKWIAESMQSG